MSTARRRRQRTGMQTGIPDVALHLCKLRSIASARNTRQHVPRSGSQSCLRKRSCNNVVFDALDAFGSVQRGARMLANKNASAHLLLAAAQARSHAGATSIDHHRAAVHRARAPEPSPESAPPHASIGADIRRLTAEEGPRGDANGEVRAAVHRLRRPGTGAGGARACSTGSPAPTGRRGPGPKVARRRTGRARAVLVRGRPPAPDSTPAGATQRAITK